MEHTPGPWTVSEESAALAVLGPDGEEIAAVESCEADADLIAAAPEMAVLLRDILVTSPSGRGSAEIEQRIREICSRLDLI